MIKTAEMHLQAALTEARTRYQRSAQIVNLSAVVPLNLHTYEREPRVAVLFEGAVAVGVIECKDVKHASALAALLIATVAARCDERGGRWI
ncbi:hypothetical protein CUW27_20740 [Salmonella enterica]|nr:hypothetical protein [Salmonella enterica]